MEVNGKPMLGKSHEEALKIFKSAKKGFLTLTIRPYKDCPSSTSRSVTSPNNLSVTESVDDGIGSSTVVFFAKVRSPPEDPRLRTLRVLVPHLSYTTGQHAFFISSHILVQSSTSDLTMQRTLL